MITAVEAKGLVLMHNADAVDETVYGGIVEYANKYITEAAEHGVNAVLLRVDDKYLDKLSEDLKNNGFETMTPTPSGRIYVSWA